MPEATSAAPTTVYTGKYLRVQKSGHWEYAERIGSTGVVVILPVTAHRHIVLIEQFRIPVGKNVIELPAGLSGDEKGAEKEDLLTAAQRELREETGYESSDWKLLAEGPSSAGLTNELITFFLAAEARPAHPPAPTPGEKIQIHEIPLADLPSWLEQKKRADSLIDYKIFAALYLAYTRYLN
jgi:ADP-ribose pyrophosphatase